MSLRKNCDYCVSKKVTCDGNAYAKACSRCLKRNRPCTFSPKQRSGPKPTKSLGARPASTQVQQTRGLAPTSPPALSLGCHTPNLVHPRAAGDRNGYGGGGGVVVAPVGKGSGGGGGRVASGSDDAGTSSASFSGWRYCNGDGFTDTGGAATASEHVPQASLLEGRRSASRRDGLETAGLRPTPRYRTPLLPSTTSKPSHITPPRQTRYAGGSAAFASYSSNANLESISTLRPISFYSGSSPGCGGDTGVSQGKGRRHHLSRCLEDDFDDADSGSDTNAGSGAGGGSKADSTGIRSGSGDGSSIVGRGKGVGDGNAALSSSDDEICWVGARRLGYGSLGPDWLFQGLSEEDNDHEDFGYDDVLGVQNQGQQQQKQVMSSKKRKEVPAGAATREEKGQPRKRHQILKPGSTSAAGGFDTPPTTSVVAAETASNTPFLERWQERENRWQRQRFCPSSRYESTVGWASSLKLPGPGMPAASLAPITASPPPQQPQQPPLLPRSDPNNSSSGSSCYKPLFPTTCSFTAGNGGDAGITAGGGPGLGAGSFQGFPGSGDGDGVGYLAPDSFDPVLLPSATSSAAPAPGPDPALVPGGHGFRSQDENLAGSAAVGTYCCQDFGIVDPCPVSWYGPGESMRSSELGLELDRELSLSDGTVELPGNGGVGDTIFGASLGVVSAGAGAGASVAVGGDGNGNVGQSLL